VPFRLAKKGELRNTIVVKKSEDKTRDLVARTILENGPQSALELAQRLNLTPAGIRRHLDRLIESGLLEAREPHRASSVARGRGRPSKVFVITDLGREKFEHSYDDLALSALRFMENLSERDLVSEFAASRANDIERRVAHAIKGASSQPKKIAALTEFLANEGYAAESKSSARPVSGAEVAEEAVEREADAMPSLSPLREWLQVLSFGKMSGIFYEA